MGLDRYFLNNGRRSGSGSNANVGALLRQRGEIDKGIFLTDPAATLEWHLRGVERTLFEDAVAAALDFENQDQDANLRIQLPTDWVAKPETLNTRSIAYRRLARARDAIAADYNVGNLKITSNKPGPEGNNDLLTITPGSGARDISNAVAAIQGNRGVVRGGDISVRSPDVVGVAASRVVRITSGSTQQIRITRLVIGEAGNDFRLLFEYDASASAGNPEVSYVSSGSGIDGILVGLRGATTFTQIINAINAATDNSNNKYVIATGADQTNGGSFSTSASFNFISTTAYWPINKQSNGAGGGLEGGSGAGGGTLTNTGAVIVQRSEARAGGTGRTASASRFLGNLAFTVTFHEAGTAGNGWVLTLTGNSGGGTTVDADAKTVAVNINGNLTYLAMKTAIDAIRVGGVQFFTASYNSGLDSQNAGNGSWTLSGGTEATTNPLTATYDEDTNSLTIVCLPTDTFDEVMDEIATLNEFQRARGGSPVDGSMPGDIWLTNGGTTLDTINTPADTSSTLDYDFAGGLNARNRSAISVADAQVRAGVAASGQWFNIPQAGLAFQYARTGTIGNGFRVETYVRYEEDLSEGRAHTDIVLGGQTIRFQWRDASSDGNGFVVRVERNNTNPGGITPVYRDHSDGSGRLTIQMPDGTYSVNEVINRVNRGLQLDGPDLRLGIVTAILETDNGNAEFTVNSSFTDIQQTFQDAGASFEVTAEYPDANTLRIYGVANQRKRYGGSDNAFLRSLMVPAINAARFEGRQLIVASSDNLAATSGFTIPSDAVDGYEARFTTTNQDALLAGGVDQANRITITGVLQTDLVSEIIAAYSGSRYTLSAVDGTPGNAIGAFSAEADQNLTGGSDPIGRLLPQVTLGDNGTISIDILAYDDEAENTTILELQDAFLAATYLDDNGNRPPFPVSNFAFSSSGGAIGSPIRNQSLPTIPTGGENLIPETPIELLSRPNDEVHGPNVEIRYHGTDTIEEIADALEEQGVQGRFIVVYGTTAESNPEDVGFVRSMLPGGGPSTVTGTTGVNVRSDGTAVGTIGKTLDFTGSGVSVTGNGNVKTINIPGGGGSIAAPLWTAGQAWEVGALSHTGRGSVYVCLTDIPASQVGNSASQTSPDASASTIWRPVSTDAGDWHTGIYLHKSQLTYHSGIPYLVLAKVDNAQTEPASDTTNYLPLGQGGPGNGNTSGGAGQRPFFQYANGNDLTTWSDTWSSGEGYMRIAVGVTKPADDSSDWTDPIRIQGDLGSPGPSTRTFIQYSDDNTAWHDTLVPASDIYIRFAVGQSKPANDNAAWSDGVRFKGDDGQDGDPGADSTVQGPPGPPGSLGLTKVGPTLAVTGSAITGPNITDLNELLKLRLEYSRGSVDNLFMWTDLPKFELSTTTKRVQVQGAGGDYIGVRINNGVLVFSNAGSPNITNEEVQIFNVGAANGIPPWDPLTTYALHDQAVWDEKLYIANKAIPGDANNDNPATATSDWELPGMGSGGGGGTQVVANPAGSDGDALDRIAIGGTNYKIPQTGYVFYARPTFTFADAAASVDISTTPWSTTILDAVSIPGRIYTEWDFVSEWFGVMEFDAGQNGEIAFNLKTTHVFNSKTIITNRTIHLAVSRQGVNSLALGMFNSVGRIALGSFTDDEGNTVTIVDADLAGPTTMSFELSATFNDQRGQGSESISNIEFIGTSGRFYQIPHGAGTPSQPNHVPSISDFEVSSGDLSPAAGSIANDDFGLAWATANSDEIMAARIVGFKGTAAPVVLLDIPSTAFAHGTGNIAIPAGISLAADETYTLRLQLFDSTNSPAANTRPTVYQDRIIRAHAPATANYHWGRVPRVENRDANTYAANINFSNNDLITDVVLDTVNGYDATPDSSGQWIFYLVAKSDQPQPVGWSSGGFPANNVFQDAVDIAYNSINHKTYIMHDDFYREHADGSVNYKPRIS